MGNELGGIIEYHSRCQVQSGNKTYPGLIILLRSHTYGLGIIGTVQYVYQILCFLCISYLSYFAFNLSGLPPLTGFFIKLNVLQIIGLSRGIILLTFSIILLYAYMRLFLLSPKHKPLTITAVLPCCLGIVF